MNVDERTRLERYASKMASIDEVNSFHLMVTGLSHHESSEEIAVQEEAP